MTSGKSRILIAAIAAPLLAAAPASDIDWAYPANLVVAPPGGWDSTRKLTLPGSTASFTQAQVKDRQHAVDWYPGRHASMPGVVAATGPDSMACGFCHLPGGTGRPENAAIAGLPAAYIVAQVTTIADGTRAAANPGWSLLMTAVARHTAPADLEVAAAYFSKLRYVSHVTVKETATIAPPVAYNLLLLPGRGPMREPMREPMGDRIVEGPVSLERFERRDPGVGVIAWVPPGSIARGKRLARGSDDRPACDNCHGKGLRGDVGPPLAGRYPSYLFRQLVAFRAGTRAAPAGEPMRAVATALTNSDIIALAAYAGSLEP